MPTTETDIEAVVKAKIRWATACAAVLGAVPVPTAFAITALQAYMMRSIATSYGLAQGHGSLVTAALVSQNVGRAAWSRLVELFPRSTPVGMVAGGLIAGAATHALGRGAAAHFRALAHADHGR